MPKRRQFIQIAVILLLAACSGESGRQAPQPTQQGSGPYWVRLAGEPDSGPSAKLTDLLPKPKEMESTEEGGTRLNGCLEANAQTSGDTLISRLLRPSMEELGFKTTDPELVPDADLQSLLPPDEGFSLEIKGDGLTLTASSRAGFRNAIAAAVQLIAIAPRTDKKPVLGNARARDIPQMAVRGLSDDLSRGQVSTREHFDRILRVMALWRMNTYFPYLEDMIRVPELPELGRDQALLEPETLAWIRQRASEYAIEVIPIVENLGHMENHLSVPDYQRYAEFPGAAVIRLGDPAVRDEFIFPIVRAVLDQLEPAALHLGGDEPFDAGKGASCSLARSPGLAELYREHLLGLEQLARERGVERFILYHDLVQSYPELMGYLNPSWQIMYWDYNPSPKATYPAVTKFGEQGITLLVSPAVQTVTRAFPNLAAIWNNVRSLTRAGADQQARGAVISHWSDYGGLAMRDWMRIGIALQGIFAWDPGWEGALDDALHRFHQVDGLPSGGAASRTEAEHAADQALIPFDGTLLSGAVQNTLLRAVLWTPPVASQRDRDGSLCASLRSAALALLEPLIGESGKALHPTPADQWLAELFQLAACRIEMEAALSTGLSLESTVEKWADELALAKATFETAWLAEYEPKGMQTVSEAISAQVWLAEQLKDAISRSEPYVPIGPAVWLDTRQELMRDQVLLLGFDLEVDREVSQGWIYVIPDGYAEVRLDGVLGGRNNVRDFLGGAFRRRMASPIPLGSILPGNHRLDIWVANFDGWFSGFTGLLAGRYKDGQPFRIGLDQPAEAYLAKWSPEAALRGEAPYGSRPAKLVGRPPSAARAGWAPPIPSSRYGSIWWVEPEDGLPALADWTLASLSMGLNFLTTGSPLPCCP